MVKVFCPSCTLDVALNHHPDCPTKGSLIENKPTTIRVCNPPTVTVELHCGRWALMVNGHGIVIEGDICRSDRFAERLWTPDMLRKVASGEKCETDRETTGFRLRSMY